MTLCGITDIRTMNIENAIEVNRKYWDEVADLHFSSSFYDVSHFKSGKSTLSPLDTHALGDVEGKALLHLHCHFGLDTLSWSQHGASVTGIDFSTRAITLAKQLAFETSIPAKFVHGDATELPIFWRDTFDIVLAIEGVVAWVYDLSRWLRSAAMALRPGGIFYLREFHPFAEVVSNNKDTMEVTDDYFRDIRLITFADDPGTYANRIYKLKNTYHYEWLHPLSHIVNSILDAGLSILDLKEFPFCTYQSHRFLVKRQEDIWVLPSGKPTIPLMYSILARKPLANSQHERNQ